MTILWDWNGTLLDDTDACVASLNLMLERRGVKPITLEFYRREFAFPVRSFYEKIGVRLEDEDWDRLAREYHDTYHAQPLGLNAEAVPALESARAAGMRQSIISAMRQDMLERDTAAFGIAGYMDYIYGTDNLNGGSKLSRARELLSRLGERDMREVVVIGDALHDWEVADGLGVRCVLFSGGGHSAERLARVAPTTDSLVDCIRLARSLGEALPDPVARVPASH